MVFVGSVSVSFPGEVSFSGLDIATAIFLLIAGLCSFKESFLMLSQNGVSRKSMFISRLLVAISIAFGMAVIDQIATTISKICLPLSGNVTSLSLYELIYLRGNPGNTLRAGAGMFVYHFFLYTLMTAAGYFITVMFYRLGKGGKIAVGAGVPALLMFGFPAADLIFGFSVTRAFGRFIDAALGLTSANPYAAMITFTVATAALSFFSWMLLKKAAVKA
jgi:hypothetical protein